MVICVGAFFIEKCPADFTPEGWKPKAVQQASAKTVPDKTWKEMITDPIFYVMILMLMCGAFSGLMVTSQASPMAQQLAGMSVGLAATAVSVLALFNAAGRGASPSSECPGGKL